MPTDHAPSSAPATPPAGYTPTPGLLAQRCILVTGAGSGLGRAAALACAQLGATVILLGKTIKTLEATYDAIESIKNAPEPAIYPLNLFGAKWEDYGELAQTLDGNLGRLDGIVHAAAHFKNFTPLAQVPPREWVESLQVNLTAPYALTTHCLPLLDKSTDASVVFITDTGSEAPRAYSGAYGIAKYAQRGLAGTWAEELGYKPHLRFNTYDPGPMRTTLRRTGYPQEDPATLADPATVLAPLLWLLGPDSRGCNGRNLGNPAGAGSNREYETRG
ncbi:MAG: SDR family NAD(P)-dependent oxidoreductase [Nevskiaceae bacterium]|nr:MAG: SDR family NAD(P)-dependent oxidoreductase [Nevskiaceae bacterium]TBR74663.1 MAG: SDR family NAD(P)-dependent oxidoreductase [Nevskiaceae bacterium]